MVQGVTKSRSQLSNSHKDTHTHVSTQDSEPDTGPALKELIVQGQSVTKHVPPVALHGILFFLKMLSGSCDQRKLEISVKIAKQVSLLQDSADPLLC